MRRLGAELSVNGERLLVLFLDDDYECVYPAQQSLKDKGPETKKWKEELFQKIEKKKHKLLLERNMNNPYDQTDKKKYTNYWKAIVDDVGETIGVIGIQVKIASYSELIPSNIIEEPYSISFINLYNKELETIWWWGCSNEPDEYIKESCDKDYNK